MAQSIEEYLNRMGISYKAHLADGSTVTAQDAAAQLGVPLKMIIKTIVFVDDKNSALVAIITGERRIDKKKLSAILSVQKVRIASPQDTMSLTGFDAGVVPPIGHRDDVQTVVDREVMSLNKVFGGSGISKVLIEVDPRDIVRLIHAKVADICEKKV